jgi:penicillin-binding protein 1A
MVDMMRGVVAAGGTATGASAGGQPLAGKTGTVNNETDVWFLGYTPTYVTGVWMGNPLRKESLGAGMTGGHGAVPYFNAFMVPFMKDKPRESFPGVPPMPAEMRTLMERNKREELEKLEKADQAAIRSGATASAPKPEAGTVPPETTETGTSPAATETKPSTTEAPPPVSKPVIKPAVRDPELPKPEQPEGSRRKGKKGDN